MKILQIVPAPKTAITTLALDIQKYNKDLDFKLLYFHPKKPDDAQMKAAREGLKWADIVDAQYWKSASKIKSLFPELWADNKKKILTHYNPYNLKEELWEEYLRVFVVNSYQKSELPSAEIIPLGIDLEAFKKVPYLSNSNIINMTVSRIEGKKGVLEVAQACKELGLRLCLVGRISDSGYMNSVLKTGSVDFHQDVLEKDLLKYYHQSTLHVCNSVDNFESGTMPILEAMSCGIPVLSRLVGHVPDLYNGKNMELIRGSNEDVELIKTRITESLANWDRLNSIRDQAFRTVQDHSSKERAASYRKVYESL